MEEATAIDGGGPNLYAWKGLFPGFVSFPLFHSLALAEYCIFSHMMFVYIYIYMFICMCTCIANMSGEALYPRSSSSYTYWDGKKYEVQCTIPGAVAGGNLSYHCPDGFVSPREEGDPRNCIQVISLRLPLPLLYALYIIFSFFFRSRNPQLLPALSSECLHHGRVRCHADCLGGSLNGWFRSECIHGCSMVCIVFQLSTIHNHG
jgi:hypothetical protein